VNRIFRLKYRFIITVLFLSTSFTLSYAQEASLNGAVLTIPVLQVGADYYLVDLTLVPDSDPVQLNVTRAELLASPASTTGASVFSSNVLSVPALPFQGSSYNLQFSLLSSEPVIFQLLSASVNESTAESTNGLGVVVGGGEAWLFQLQECTQWSLIDAGSAAGVGFANDNHGNSGVKAEVLSVDSGTCSVSLQYVYGLSLIDGDRKLKGNHPPLTESVQGQNPVVETENYSYTQQSAAGGLVELLRRVDTLSNSPDLPIEDGEADTAIASSMVYGYETGTSTTLPRPNFYEEYERVINSDGFNELIVTLTVSWDYESDGSVIFASFSQFDEDVEGFINGQYRFVMEDGELVIYVEANLAGDIIPLQKTVVPGKTLFDLTQLPLPPKTGQILTENSWDLPFAFTRYLWDAESSSWTIFEKREIDLVTDEGYPIRLLYSSLNDDGELRLESTSYYGYKTDLAGTIYNWVELQENDFGDQQVFLREFYSSVPEFEL